MCLAMTDIAFAISCGLENMDRRFHKLERCVGYSGVLTRSRTSNAHVSNRLLHHSLTIDNGSMDMPNTQSDQPYVAELHNKFGKAPVLGKGAFATVYDVGAGRCVKIEKLDPGLSDRALITPLATAIWAGGAGIAPRVHTWQVWRDDRVGDAVLVLEMDRIDGAALGSWVLAEGRSRLDVMHMARLLRSCILALGRAEVSHNDLHLFNVMVSDCKVSGSPRPWLIDFTLSRVGPRAGLTGNIHGCVVAEMWRAFESTGPTHVSAGGHL
jgi:predicted Ser/Thr protein kinase